MKSTRNRSRLADQGTKEMLPVIFSLAWPTMLEQLMQTAVQYMDTGMVGVLGTSATAAVGATSTVNWLIGSTISAISIGFLAYISQSIGAGKKEQAKKARKIFAGEEKRACLFRDRREAAPSLLNRNAAKIGEVVFTKSDVTVLDIGIIKRINPLEIYARSTSLDRFGIPCQYGGVEYCRWYGTGIVVSLDMWRNITKDASAEEVCKRMNIPYWQR